MQRLCSHWFVLACALLLSMGSAAVADDAAPATAEKETAAATKEEAKPADEAAKAKAEAAAKEAAEEFELQKLFADTIDQVERNYVKDISRRELMEAAIRGVLTKLDPYSNYISPQDLGQFKTNVDNQFGGIGIQVDIPREGQLIVISPIVGSPAYRAGMQAGDRIIEIEGETTAEIRQLDDAIKRLKGEPGSKVTITTFRPSSGKRRTFSLDREIVHVDTVMGDQRKDDDSWDFLLDHEKKIGYIRVTAFGRDTERDLTRALEELKREGVRGLILDLRFNPGGLLTAAIGVSDLFVSEGKIVSTEGRNTTPRSWEAQKDGVFEDLPMVVLVNHYSASASEIVSACLQDHKRAVIIGERTWGKGSVQNVIELEGGRSALKLTTAAYMRPSGKNIHKREDSKESDEWGVSPNDGFELKLPEEELAQLHLYRRDRDILLINHSGGDKEPDAENTKEGDESKEAPKDVAKDAGEAKDKPADAKESDQPKADEKPKVEDKPKAEDAPQDDKPAADKPPEEKPPADKDAGDKKPEEKTPDEKADAKESKAAKRSKFVDRQLQKALDYLNAEIAKAG
ncbi:MAG TPA: S41 family peptidase [Pirellulales bacterium]|jgi:carboxyl-terminal processing protease